MKFPSVSGSNLSRKKFQLPYDFEGKLNLVFIPFQQSQQWTINTWVDFAAQLEKEHHHFRAYEIPTLQSMNPLSQKLINEGMRTGIQDQRMRDKVITLYTEKSTFRRSLGIPNENEVFVFLVDRSGNVFWRSSGALTAEKKQSLLQSMEQASKPAWNGARQQALDLA